MKEITSWLHESSYIEPLSPGCSMCAHGSKLVVLITGLCSASCFYCPLSFKKGGRDVIYADEWELKDENDIDTLLQEARYIEAEGAGLTGGDPLIKWERTIKYIDLLKNEFGSSFHIHLYTSGLENSESISDIIDAGLDELRFHPLPIYWDNMDNSPIAASITKALDTPADIALEVPSIPHWEKYLVHLVNWAEMQGIPFVNLNELEFSERNVTNFEQKGFNVKEDISAAALDSQETALIVLQHVAMTDWNIGVHYCSSSFKDGVQLTNRIKRRAKNIAHVNDIITEEGTILKGIIELPANSSLFSLQKLLQTMFQLLPNTLYVSKENNRIELHPYILEKIARKLSKKGYKCFIIEEYPTADKLEVERIPLI